jgi:MFS family permease
VLSTDRAMRLSVWDGVLFALGVGFGETYFLAEAVRLGASLTQIALVVSLPVGAGAAGALLSLQILRRATRRRPIVVTAAIAQATTVLALVAGEVTGTLTPVSLIVALCLYQVFGQAAGTAWSSWFGDLVPDEMRGRYFAKRQRWVHLSTCAGLIAAGGVLALVEPRIGVRGGGLGFAIIFGIAASLRLTSSALLAATPEPPFRGLSGRERLLQFLQTTRGRGAARLLMLGGSMQCAVYLGAAFFTPFMLRELSFSYLEYTGAMVTVVVFKFVMLPAWGRTVDAHGARSVYPAAAFLVAIVPLPWLWTTGLFWVVVAQAMSGFSWAGHEISALTLMLESSSRKTRAQVFAIQSVVNGAAVLLGSLGGALIVGLGGANYRLAFSASALGRLVVAVAAARLLPGLPGRPASGRREILLRVVGFRPDGGLRQRPVDAPSDAAD